MFRAVAVAGLCLGRVATYKLCRALSDLWRGGRGRGEAGDGRRARVYTRDGVCVRAGHRGWMGDRWGWAGADGRAGAGAVG